MGRINYYNTITQAAKLDQLARCRFMSRGEFANGIAAIAGKKIVIVGCGAQGLNQGLNMRDSGCDISYTLRQEAIDAKRASYVNATTNGFKVGTYEELVPTADMVLNLTPDKQHTAVVSAIMPHMKKVTQRAGQQPPRPPPANPIRMPMEAQPLLRCQQPLLAHAHRHASASHASASHPLPILACLALPCLALPLPGRDPRLLARLQHRRGGDADPPRPDCDHGGAQVPGHGGARGVQARLWRAHAHCRPPRERSRRPRPRAGQGVRCRHWW